MPQFESDLKDYLKEKSDREAYEKLNAPTTIVVRFGYLRMVGEFPHTGTEKPGCGSKLVVKTNRGTEIGEMLTSTCQNSGCSKSVTRKEMLSYIENSGGRQYPFFELGRVLRIATGDDLIEQRRLEDGKSKIVNVTKKMVAEYGLEMTVIEAEPIFGNERIVIYFGAEDRVDFRDLVQDLSKEFGTKVELRQIGARDEARITADYERCGQYCCCKSFLKVLKPVSMKSAKIQKATLDPLKISGRCGRLMCCLRYEDETYEELRKNLPHRKSRVGTPEGDGIVISTQILTQLALVRLDNNTDVAIPIEDLCEPDSKTAPEPGARAGARSGMRSGSLAKSSKRRGPGSGSEKSKDEGEGETRSSGSRGGKRNRRRPAKSGEAKGNRVGSGEASSTVGSGEGQTAKKKKRRRRKRTRTGGEGGGQGAGAQQGAQQPQGDGSGESGSGSGTGSDSSSGSVGAGGEPIKKKKRRRRRKPSGDGSGGTTGGTTGGTPNGSAGDSGSSE